MQDGVMLVVSSDKKHKIWIRASWLKSNDLLPEVAPENKLNQ